MPAANGNQTTISQKTRINLSVTALLGIILFLVSAAVGWGLFAGQARTALTREEAYKSFVTQQNYGADIAALDSRLSRMESKIDALLMK